MAKDRKFVCEYYYYNGGCAKGKNASFRGYCQRCQLYKAKKGAAPAFKNLKREKEKDYQDRDFKQRLKEF